jgi:iron complex transport system substrate-binding protein
LIKVRYVVKIFAPLFLALFSTFLLIPGRATAHLGSAAKSHFPLTVVDDLHNHVRIASLPKRIVSLDPADTETLFALGLEKRVVGDGGKDVEGAQGISRSFRYPSEWPSPWGRDYPVRSKKLPHVEGGFGSAPFNIETIESLRPDLILSLNSDAQTLQKLRDLGLTVIVLDPANINGIFRDIKAVGKATAEDEHAAVLIRTMKAELSSVRSRLKQVKTNQRVYYEIDATNPTQPFTAGPGTYIDEAIRLAGGKNVADGIRSPGCPGTGCYPALSLEALVKLNPQRIILGDAAYGTSASSVKARPGWGVISAVQSGKIYPFDDDLVSRRGPRITIGIQRLARIIHPATFRS